MHYPQRINDEQLILFYSFFYYFFFIYKYLKILLQLDSRSFGSASDYDHDTMIKKLSKQREENSQLVNQNHKIMTELENLSYDLHQARNKVSYRMIK